MDEHRYIADLAPGQEVDGFYLLNDAALKTSSNGKPFLSAKAADRSGSVDLKVWDYSGPIGGADSGSVVRLRGAVTEFKGSPQLIAAKIRLAEASDRFELDPLLPVAPIDEGAALDRVRELVSSIEDADYKALAELLLERNLESFRSIPAAKSVHHSFLHGLLMHTADMMEAADFLAWLYQRIIDRSLLMAGTLLHDLMKREEFSFSRLGLVTDYSVKGELLGHLVMGAQAVADAARELGTPEEKSVLLQHMILSHHGDPEFGAAVTPKCAEAELLSCIDKMDSRMEIYTEVLETVPEGGFSDRVFSLEKRIHRHR